MGQRFRARRLLQPERGGCYSPSEAAVTASSVDTSLVQEGENHTGAKIRNMRLAKHRFESTHKPLFRLCMYLRAFIMAAVQLLRTRDCNNKADPCVVAALHFLSFLDIERLITVAMAADAADTVARFTRFLDTEAHDVSRLPSECLRCANTLVYLFVDGGCYSQGLTEHMLQTLRVPHTWVLNNEVKTVGGDEGRLHDAYDRCLVRMKAVTKLSVTTLRAEFPSFDKLVAFSIFDLGSTITPTPEVGTTKTRVVVLI
jgi:hypothetical protein